MTDIYNSEIFLKILRIVITVVAAIISITVHEVSHGFAAYKCGDRAYRRKKQHYHQKQTSESSLLTELFLLYLHCVKITDALRKMQRHAQKNYISNN